MQIFALLLATIFLAANVSAAELPDPGILPGSFLYSFKMWREEIGDWFTFGEVRTMNRLLERASIRLSEYRALAGGEENKLLADAEKNYVDVWQEFWSRLENTDDRSAFAEHAVRAYMEHRFAISSVDGNAENMKQIIGNGEIRGVRLLLEQYPEQGQTMLGELFTDRLRHVPQTTVQDIVALDPLVGLLRATGEKNVIVMTMEGMKILDEMPASRDRDAFEQHLFQVIGGDILRYAAINPEDAVNILRDLLEGRLFLVEALTVESGSEVIIKRLGALSIVLDIVDSVVPSHRAAAQSLTLVLENVMSRLENLSIVGHEQMIEDQERHIAQSIHMLQPSSIQDDLARSIPPEILKMFPDLPWNIPSVQPLAYPSIEERVVEQKMDIEPIQKIVIPDLTETIKTRLSPILPGSRTGGH